MTCACKPVIIQAYAQNKQRPGVEIAGTWDFKWPRNTVIRIAFQRPPGLTDDEFYAIRDKIIHGASSWPVRVIVQQPDGSDKLVQKGNVAIGLHFLWQALDEPLGEQAVLGSEHHSPFLLPADQVILEYDVLVNLENLPLARIDPFKFKGAPQPVQAASSTGRERVLLPLSELGSYSRRADYGAPTVFIGRFGSAIAKPLLAHFSDTLGQHVIVHEFGHVLGLPHEHQNPYYGDRPYRPLPDLVREIQDGFELLHAPTTAEIDVQVVQPWPGSKDFSDWGDPGKATLYELESVMTYPYHLDLLRPPKEVKSKLSKLTTGETISGSQQILVKPQPVDVENLVRMYGVSGGIEAKVAAAE